MILFAPNPAKNAPLGSEGRHPAEGMGYHPPQKIFIDRATYA